MQEFVCDLSIVCLLEETACVRRCQYKSKWRRAAAPSHTDTTSMKLLFREASQAEHLYRLIIDKAFDAFI
ncbi:MAG: hypothetical protein ACREX0_06570, partial [Noviherbaspirillum sp.]